MTERLADGKLRLDRPAPHVARLTIDNPEKRNALDHAILDGIAQTARELNDARCLILTAEGAVFSAGYDIGGAAQGRVRPPRPSRSSPTRSTTRSRRSRRSPIPPWPPSTATPSAAAWSSR